MEEVRPWTRSSTEDFCLYSSSEMYRISKFIDQELDTGLLLILLIERRKLLLIFLIESV
jgi:hypothetical protein